MEGGGRAGLGGGILIESLSQHIHSIFKMCLGRYFIKSNPFLYYLDNTFQLPCISFFLVSIGMMPLVFRVIFVWVNMYL